MQNRKRILIPLTAILISIMLSAAACSSAAKTDSYVPATFTVQGGTGKVTITCPEVTLTGDEAQALIEISSPHYEWLKVNGVQYDAENAGDKNRKNSVFRIPVVLDQEMTITGLTTAMSQPHEIEYTLFISLTRTDEAGSAGEGVGKAPAVGDGGLQVGHGDVRPVQVLADRFDAGVTCRYSSGNQNIAAGGDLYRIVHEYSPFLVSFGSLYNMRMRLARK